MLKEKLNLFVDFEFLDGNGLLGHRLIDSRWFEKILQREVVENGVQKNANIPVFRTEMLMTQFVLSSSRHLVTPLIYMHFCVRVELFVDLWWLKEVWYAPDFCQTVVLVCPSLLQNKRKPE